MTATDVAPASTTARARSRVMPPIATTGTPFANSTADLTPSRPTTGSGWLLEAVAKTGPIAR